MKIELDAGFVKQAYDSACESWKQKIQERVGDKIDLENYCQERTPVPGDIIIQSLGALVVTHVNPDFKWNSNECFNGFKIAGEEFADVGMYPYGSHNSRLATDDEKKALQDMVMRDNFKSVIPQI